MARLGTPLGVRRAAVQPPAPLAGRFRRAGAGRRARAPPPRAEAGGGGGGGGGLGGLFGGKGNKEDAARKALQDAFAGRKDPFAEAEARRAAKGGGGSGGGGGGGGSGGGGGGGFGGGFSFDDFSDGLRKWARATGRTIAAVALFLAAISVFYLWRPLIALATALARAALRLDGNPRAQLAARPAAPRPDFTKADGLGNVEADVIARYRDAGGDDDSDESGSETDDD